MADDIIPVAESGPVTVETLQAQLIEQQAQNKTIQEQLSTLAALVNTTTKVDTAPQKLPTVPTGIVKVGKKKYKWNVASFKMPGSSEAITAAEASTDDSLIAEILKIEGQGLLAEQV